MHSQWCVGVLKEAIAGYGKPYIINSAQGSQFTFDTYIDFLKANEIQTSMDVRERA